MGNKYNIEDYQRLSALLAGVQNPEARQPASMSSDSSIPAMDQYQFATQDVGMDIPPPPNPYTPVGNTLDNLPNMSVGNPSSTGEDSSAMQEGDASGKVPASIMSAFGRGPNPSQQLNMLNLNDDEMSSAMKDRSDLQNMVNLTRAGARIGTALATGGSNSIDKLAPDYLKDLEAQSGQGVSDVAMKRKMVDDLIKRQESFAQLTTIREKSDPNSEVSKMYRQLGKQFLPNMPDSISASQIEKALPYVSQMYMAKESADAKREADKEKQGQKDEQTLLKLNERIAQNVNPAAPKGGLKRLTDGRARIMALKAFAAGTPLNELTPQQVSELAIALDTVISGGGSSVERFRHLKANTARGTLSNVTQWISNHPQGAEQGEFVQNILKSANNEGAAIDRQIKEHQFKELYTFKKNYENLGPAGVEEFYKHAQTWTGVPEENIRAMEADPKFTHNYIPAYDPNAKPLDLDTVTMNKKKTTPQTPSDYVRMKNKVSGEEKYVPKVNVPVAKERGWDEVK